MFKVKVPPIVTARRMWTCPLRLTHWIIGWSNPQNPSLNTECQAERQWPFLQSLVVCRREWNPKEGHSKTRSLNCEVEPPGWLSKKELPPLTLTLSRMGTKWEVVSGCETTNVIDIGIIFFILQRAVFCTVTVARKKVNNWHWHVWGAQHRWLESIQTNFYECIKKLWLFNKIESTCFQLCESSRTFE